MEGILLCHAHAAFLSAEIDKKSTSFYKRIAKRTEGTRSCIEQPFKHLFLAKSELSKVAKK